MMASLFGVLDPGGELVRVEGTLGAVKPVDEVGVISGRGTGSILDKIWRKRATLA